MYNIGIFLVELIALFILSRYVTGSISQFIYKVTGSTKMAVYTLALLFFPGTVIHELSHFFIANLLFVRTGDMEFVPKMFDDRVKLGSVQIEKTDPIRRALIGVAPFIIGTLLMVLIFFATEFYNLWGSIWMSILILYILFEIGNTMFSSQKDMEGVLELLAIILIFGFILFFAGLRIPDSFFEFLLSDSISSVFEKASRYLLIPLGIDIAIIGITRGLLNLLRR